MAGSWLLILFFILKFTIQPWIAIRVNVVMSNAAIPGIAKKIRSHRFERNVKNFWAETSVRE
jgi:hypothetical protein